MEQTKVAKQIVNFQKSGFDIAYTAMKIVQDGADVTANKLISQNETLVKDGRAFVAEWMTCCKKGQEELHKVASEQLDPNVVGIQKEMAVQFQSQAEAITDALFTQADRILRRGSELYSNGLEMKNSFQDSCKQSVDAAFKNVESIL